MDSSEEERILELAIKRGELTEGDLRAASDAELLVWPDSGTVRGPYGPRLDRLIELGRLNVRLVNALIDELAAQDQTLDRAQSPTNRRVLAQGGSASEGEGTLRTDEDLAHLLKWDRYALEVRLGQGGMGAVYRAFDERLGRTVAVKFMLRADPQTTQRFLREARAQARIQHPAVCQIFDAGEYAGVPYIAMEHLTGAPLHIAQAGMSLEQKLLAAREIAGGLEAAHRLGIIHRDIKPQNIFAFQRPDGQWQAKVLDFGLAVDESRLDSLTESGAIVGTPAYMSPEQAAGGASVDHRADLYSLGAVLYQLLTGEPPFSGRSPAEVLHRVLHEEPIAPRRRVPSLPRALEHITLKCLRKEPRLRYESAQALADELGRYLAGEPIAAARGSFTYRMRQGARRHRVLLGLALVALTGLGGDVAVSVRERHAADRRAHLAHELGREVELGELFLRSAYLMPLHSIRPEQDEVHARVHRIEAQLQSLGRAEAALAHHALGRAYLALRDYSLAVQHLRSALQVESADSGLHYDLGLALGSLYQMQLRDVESQCDPTWRAQREKELRAQYLEPAQAHFLRFQQSGAQRLESPEYAESVIAFFNHDPERAIERARAALSKQPWRFEVKRLLGDVYYRRGVGGIERRDYAAARADLRSAVQHYQEAEAIAHSDPLLHLAAADAWKACVQLDMLQGVDPQASLEQALLACTRLARSDPEESRQFAIEYTVYFSMAYYRLEHGTDPEPSLERALAAAQSCIRRRPQEPFCHDAAATVWGFRARLALSQGRDATEPLRSAQLHHRRALDLNPNLARLWHGRGTIQLLGCKQQMLRGAPERPCIENALADFRKARELDPQQFSSNEVLLQSLASYGGFLVQRGQTPEWPLAEAISWSQVARSYGGLTFPARESLAELFVLAAGYDLARGREPSSLLASAEAELQEALRINPSAPRSHRILGSVYHLRAQLVEAAGGSPAALLERAHAALSRSLELNPSDRTAQEERALVQSAMARASTLASRPEHPAKLRIRQHARSSKI